MTTALVKAEKVYATTKKLTVTKPKELPKRTDIKDPLTPEQNAIIHDLHKKWVATSNLSNKPITFAGAWGKLFKWGLNGAVNALNQIEQSEFDTCRRYINQEIKKLESIDPTGLTRYKSDYRATRIKTIQTIRSKQKVSPEKLKEYLVARWDKNSLTELDDDELETCYRYALGNNKNPSWIFSAREIEGTDQQRERSIILLLNQLEEDAKNVDCIFDRNRVDIKKDAFLSMLAQRDRTLWTVNGELIEITTLDRVRSKFKLFRFKSGTGKRAK